MHVKKGDKVIVIAGKEKGKKAIISKVFKEENRVLLEGLNLVKRHMRPKKSGEKGGIVEKPSSIDASNVKLEEKKVKETKKAKSVKKTKKEE